MKVLFIAPHLSTGGLPQYLLKKIETIKDKYDIYVVEWENITGGVFVVQRNKIQKLLGNKFYSLDADKNKIFDIINSIAPDIIHFEELPETFINTNILDVIYKKDRNCAFFGYKIVCSTHSSFSDPKTITYGADKYILPCEWSKKIFQEAFPDVECSVWEYPVIPVDYNKIEAKKDLGFDLDYKHVLHVGLFTPGKNQRELIDLARSMIDHKILFHFVGNQADNFADYWQPLMQNLPNNCIWHGERDDVERFYKASDLFYFPSVYELNPLALKEALSYKLPIFTKKLHTYENKYDNIAHYITNDQNINKQNVLKVLNSEKKEKKIKAAHILVDIESDREKKSIASMSKLSSEIEYIQCINERYVGDEWKYQMPIDGWKKHGPGHYGAFQSFKKAILNNFTDDDDCLLLFEADCVLDVDKETFMKNVYLALNFCNKHEIPYFSFGPRVINGFLESEELASDIEYPNFIITNKIFETHCVLLTKYFKKYHWDHLQTTWDSTDIWFNHVCRSSKMAITRVPLAYQTQGMSMIDNCIKGKNLQPKIVLVLSTARRFHYFEKTITSFFNKNPDIKNYIKKTWVLDDRSSKEDRFKMDQLLSSHLNDNYNMLCFNSNEKYEFIEKLNFINKVIQPTDIILFLEDDWECVSNINLNQHVKKLIESDYTQISFTDPLDIQEQETKDSCKLDEIYWKNPWPKCYKHIYKYEKDIMHWASVKMNHFTLNPSLIKASVFLSEQFKKEKNFEGAFADANNNKKHIITINQLFKHIGNDSLINSLS